MKSILKKSLLFFLAISASSAIVCGQNGYKINIRANGLNNSRVQLAFHLGSSQYLKDSVITDEKGQCRFSGEEVLPSGIYMIVFPGKKYVEFLIEKDQFFTISCDTADLASSIKIEGSELNQSFISYQREWKKLQEESIGLQNKMKKSSNNKEDYDKLKETFSKHEESMKSWLGSEADKNKGTLLGAIIRSFIPVPVMIREIPDNVINKDSVKRLWSYIYYKDHFFDNIDLQNQGLIRTPVLGAKLEQFFTQVVVQSPDSIIKEADIVIKRCEPQKEVYQYVTSWIFNKFTTSAYMGHDAVVVHLAESIYLAGKAPWVSDDFLSDLSKRVKRIKPNLIGNNAIDLVMNSFSGQYVSLSDIKAEFTILYFWEPDCGHCKEATPLLKEFYDKHKDSGIEIFAVCTKDDKEKWEKYILDNGLTWINGWDPDRLSHFDYYYNVESTPLIYILDKSKKIIAKKLSVEYLWPFIENYKAYQRSIKVASPR